MLSFDAESNCEPLRFIDGRFIQIDDGIQTARLAFLFRRAVELNFVAFVKVFLITQLAICVEEDS